MERVGEWQKLAALQFGDQYHLVARVKTPRGYSTSDASPHYRHFLLPHPSLACKLKEDTGGR